MTARNFQLMIFGDTLLNSAIFYSLMLANARMCKCNYETKCGSNI